MDNILKFSDLFDAIICICMESEEHKWVNQCVPQFKKLGINADDVIRHPGGDKSEFKGSHGCCVAHYNVLKFCKEKKFKRPLILESDFWVTKKYNLNNIVNAFNFLDNLDWNVMSLGGKLKSNNPKLISNSLLKAPSEYTHAIVYNGKYINHLLKTVEKMLRIKPNLNIDQIYSRYRYGIADKCYMTKDLCFLQAENNKANIRTRRARQVYRKRIKKIKEQM